MCVRAGRRDVDGRSRVGSEVGGVGEVCDVGRYPEIATWLWLCGSCGGLTARTRFSSLAETAEGGCLQYFQTTHDCASSDNRAALAALLINRVLLSDVATDACLQVRYCGSRVPTSCPVLAQTSS
jgi:hypothetical protein